jgi:hypothetical protein
LLASVHDRPQGRAAQRLSQVLVASQPGNDTRWLPQLGEEPLYQPLRLRPHAFDLAPGLVARL